METGRIAVSRQVSHQGGRNLNVEALRILAMLLIVLGHCIGHNHLVEEYGGLVRYILKFIQIVTLPATNCFVLVTGYYQSQTSFKPRKLFLLWLQVFFFSALLFLISLACWKTVFRPAECIKALLPISGNQYWFLRVFLGLYLLSPFLNELVKALPQKEFQLFLLTNFILFSLWRSFLPFAITLNSEGGNSIIWFLVLYMTGAYLAKFPVPFSARQIRWALAGLLFFAFGTWIVFDKLSNRLGLNGKGTSLFTEFTAFPIYGIAICTLLLAVNHKSFFNNERARRIVNTFAASVLGVYMLHENIYVKRVLWPYMDLPSISARLLLPTLLLATCLIFVGCVIIDQLTWQPVSAIIRKSTESS